MTPTQLTEIFLLHEYRILFINEIHWPELNLFSFLINVKFITERVKTNLASSHSVISEILQTSYLHIIYEFLGHKMHTNNWYAIRNIWL